MSHVTVVMHQKRNVGPEPNPTVTEMEVNALDELHFLENNFAPVVFCIRSLHCTREHFHTHKTYLSLGSTSHV